MRAVNLIPADRRGPRRASPLAPLLQNPLLAIAIVVVVAVVAGIAVEIQSAASTVSARQSTLRDLDAQVAKLPKPNSTGPGTASASSRLSVVTAVANQRTAWDGFLSVVSRVLPEDVWLDNMSATAPSGAALAGAPSAGFTVSGYTYTLPSVARLMRRLRLVPWLNGVSLTTSSKTSLDNQTLYQFTLGANVISLPEVGS